MHAFRTAPGSQPRLRTLVAALLLTLGGCGGPPEPPDDGTAEALPDVWTCRLGTQGGFTGGGGGFLVHSDGRVQSWSQTTSNAEVETLLLGTADEDRMRTLRRALAASQLSTTRFRETGNMTTFLEIIRTDGRRLWSWPAGRPAGRTIKVPEAVQRCYDAAFDAASTVSPFP